MARNCSGWKRNSETLQAKLTELQGERPLILPTADAQAVASVVADWTGIPVGRMVKNEIETVLNLAEIIDSAHHRAAPCPGDDQQTHLYLARAPG